AVRAKSTQAARRSRKTERRVAQTGCSHPVCLALTGHERNPLPDQSGAADPEVRRGGRGAALAVRTGRSRWPRTAPGRFVGHASPAGRIRKPAATGLERAGSAARRLVRCRRTDAAETARRTLPAGTTADRAGRAFRRVTTGGRAGSAPGLPESHAARAPGV